tara:strand:- start:3709 stop:3900 length:192 start_codon:yes stop_codon:yes gene_type:complete
MLEGVNNTSESRVFVNVFHLAKEEDKAQYEEIINGENMIITREQFTYDRSGKPIITVWWTKED